MFTVLQKSPDKTTNFINQIRMKLKGWNPLDATNQTTRQTYFSRRRKNRISWHYHVGTKMSSRCTIDPREPGEIRTPRNSSIRVTARHARSTSRKRGSPATHNFVGQWRESRRSNRWAKIPRNVGGPRIRSATRSLYNSPLLTAWSEGRDLHGVGGRARFEEKPESHKLERTRPRMI